MLLAGGVGAERAGRQASQAWPSDPRGMGLKALEWEELSGKKRAAKG